MKKKKVLFSLLLILFVLLGLSSIIPINSMIASKERVLEEERFYAEKCRSTNIVDLEHDLEEYCEMIKNKNYDNISLSSFETYNFCVGFFREYISELITILIVIIASCWYSSKYLRNRIILNDSLRIPYSNIKKKLFFSSWKYSILVPIMLFISIIIVYLFVGNFDVTSYDLSSFLLKDTIFSKTTLLYYIFLLINSFILSLLYTNLSLIVTRKEHNFVLAIIKTYLLIIGIEIFFEVVLDGLILRSIFEINFGILFNILTLYNYSFYDFSFGDIAKLLVDFVFLLISFVILFILYNKKERLIIDCEKNDSKEEV